MPVAKQHPHPVLERHRLSGTLPHAASALSTAPYKHRSDVFRIPFFLSLSLSLFRSSAGLSHRQDAAPAYSTVNVPFIHAWTVGAADGGSAQLPTVLRSMQSRLLLISNQLGLWVRHVRSCAVCCCVSLLKLRIFCFTARIRYEPLRDLLDFHGFSVQLSSLLFRSKATVCQKATHIERTKNAKLVR